MKNYWIASNPGAAYGMGLITAERYFALTGGTSSGASGASKGASTRGTYYPSTAPDGRDASVVQRELRNKGYNIVVDGAWGEEGASARGTRSTAAESPASPPRPRAPARAQAAAAAHPQGGQSPCADGRTHEEKHVLYRAGHRAARGTGLHVRTAGRADGGLSSR